MSLDSQQRASQEQFSRQSRNYGKSHLLANTEDIEAAFDGIVLTPGTRALDVATGGGHTAVWLAAKGCAVTASDLSSEMLARAQELAGERGLAIEVARHPAEALPYDDRFFSVVTCRIAAHHFSDPAKFLCEASRILAPGGHLVLIDGSIPDGEPEAEAWIHQVEKLRDPSHGRFLSPAKWTKLAEAAGLEVRSTRLAPLKQANLEAYFETAATPEANRVAARQVVRDCPPRAREVFQLSEEEGRIVWWWPRLTLVAQKPGRPAAPEGTGCR